MKENKSEWKIWLQYSKEDLDSAIVLSHTKERFPRNVCYLCQQSSEKALKAIYIFLNLPFHKKHDLDLLLNDLPNDYKVNLSLLGLTELTEWAIEVRYPGDFILPDEQEMNESIKFAKNNYVAIFDLLTSQSK